MLDMVFVAQGGDVASSQGLATRLADEVETTKVIAFTERML